MNLERKYIEYIKGNKFDKGFQFRIKGEDRAKHKDKIDFLCDIIKGKTVVHLGCMDHIECIDSKIQNNIWLHKIITEHAKECIGIDINKEAIKYVKEKYVGEI